MDWEGSSSSCERADSNAEYLPIISGGAAVALAEAVVKELEALLCGLRQPRMRTGESTFSDLGLTATTRI